MKAKAPGKVVLSGAYAVLEGAPCIVTAVDRYVCADSRKPAEHIAEEVRAAMAAPYPHIDASALRSGGRKLGLGSSAAIVVASLAAVQTDDCETQGAKQTLFETAWNAHKRAQGGGSGVDVAAATFGGTLCYHFLPDRPGTMAPVTLPALHFEIWCCPNAASTRGYLEQVRHFKNKHAAAHNALFASLGSAARQAHEACLTGNTANWLQALRTQAQAFEELGQQAQISIFTPEVSALSTLAQREGAVVIPAGAGGGDLVLYCSTKPPSSALIRARSGRQIEALDVQLGARGVHHV
jgi:phosphomevalonate kinase